jgi:hypothetical protein
VPGYVPWRRRMSVMNGSAKASVASSKVVTRTMTVGSNAPAVMSSSGLASTARGVYPAGAERNDVHVHPVDRQRHRLAAVNAPEMHVHTPAGPVDHKAKARPSGDPVVSTVTSNKPRSR